MTVSDARNEEAAGDGVAFIDPAFAAAWNDVFDEAPAEEAGAGAEATGAAADGASASAAADEGAGLGDGGAAAPATGTQPAAADPDSGSNALGQIADTLAGAAGTQLDPGAAAAGDGQAQPAGEPAAGDGVRSYDEVVPLFGQASKAIEENTSKAFEAQATSELQEKFSGAFALLEDIPYLMVGKTVPNLRGDGEVTLRDTTEAEQYQKALGRIIDGERQKLISQKHDQVRPIMSVVQESVLLFQNNKDLVPNTKEFDPELAEAFTRTARAYELRADGKLVGYHVNVQPLINELRTQLATRRGASSAQQPQQTARQQQAAQQPRNDVGQFDAPQAAIPSKVADSGEADDSYDAFWTTVGMGGMPV
jgi:hypothetical protein